MAPREIRIIGIAGLPEIARGVDLAAEIVSAVEQQGTPMQTGDILVVTQKVVSKTEGRVVALASVTPSAIAFRFAEEWGKDARQVEVALREARRIVRMANGVLITETAHGLVCANSGVDASNAAAEGLVLLLPEDPDGSARRIRDGIAVRAGVRPAVIVSDTFGRPWREGQTNVAIGVAGIEPVHDYRGLVDGVGYQLAVTAIAVADEIAGAAELVMRKLDRVPVAIVRGWPHEPSEAASSRSLIREASRDLFR